MRRKILTTLFIGLMMSLAPGIAMGQQTAPKVERTLRVEKAGTLISLLTEEEANSITHLTLEGTLNAEDFRHLRDEFASLQVLDLSQVEVRMYSGREGTFPDRQFYMYMRNFVPAYAFCHAEKEGAVKGKETLKKVILPDRTRNVEDAAFKGCKNLRICQIRREKAPNLLPEALCDSVTAVFVPAGCADAYRRKDRWGAFAILEGEPVVAHLQVGLMGTLEEEIRKAGLQPKDIHFLTVEGKLDEADMKLIRDYMPLLVGIDLSQTNATVLPPFAFAQKKFLLYAELPHGLTTIGERAFSECFRLAGTLNLPPTTTAIESGAFMGCRKLQRVVATGNSLTTIGDDLFGTDSPAKLVLPPQ